ncbi:hypothetical protein CLV91_2127 [Maribacter vaceletii]|uniref:Peptidoglycan-binding protein LysM n=1 Tax=Maribacter vaceletii TaxID=1206816 RepID=A0A495E908_9FLAO|nr:hypothetical protein [Maribacter vaceletii]RKR13408.1 hypothetical protein CLV91_2127 [Maribacter vaceletii]
MRRWIYVSSPLIVMFIFISFGFKTQEVTVPETLKVKEPTKVLFPKNKTYFTNLVIVPPFLGSSYIGFKEALAFKESQGNYFVTNTLGYLGKYQFGVETLELMGVYNPTIFLNDPVLQERVFYTNVSRNKWILRRDIRRFVGKKIGGIVVTESGMLAAAHLAGAGNVQKYLRSYGSHNVADAYGSTVSKYLKKFSGYDISYVSPKRNPKI